MRVLYIGGTGEISYSCLHEGVGLGQEVVVFNRGRSDEPLPPGVQRIQGDLADDDAYRRLGRQRWDVVCQFKAFKLPEIERDLEVFGGKVGQYVFISSASAYQKPPPTHVITEAVPLVNPYWPYSAAKAECEARLQEAHRRGTLPVTIVRPSHTYRRRFPTVVAGADAVAWRMLQGRPVVLPGDGTSLWTITHSDDFAWAFARLLGNPGALGEAFHITAHLHAWPWNVIYAEAARALGVEARLVHVPSDTLIRYRPDWAGPLLGDKTWSVLFDNSKVRSVVGAWPCRVDLAEGMRRAVAHMRPGLATHDGAGEIHALLDRIAQDQSRLGA